MIEKVAKAIALSVEEAQLEFWEEFIDQAKAAIAAMREPTEEMMNVEAYSNVHSTRLNCYEKMIDAALKE